MSDFKIDHAGLAAVLKMPGVRAMTSAVAEGIAELERNIRPGADIAVDNYTTDRAASSVTIREPQGRLWHARDGDLTRVAAALGLEVTER